MTFEVNWQTRFKYPLDLNRQMSEIYALMKIKEKQIALAKERMK